jgi:hypothetical protein
MYNQAMSLLSGASIHGRNIYNDLEDAQDQNISQEWGAKLPFEACICGPGKFYERGHAVYKTKVGLFSLAIDPLYKAAGAKVRFDPCQYYPSMGWNPDNQGKGGGFDLISDLQLSSIAHGQCCLVSKGDGHERKLFCSCFCALDSNNQQKSIQKTPFLSNRFISS